MPARVGLDEGSAFSVSPNVSRSSAVAPLELGAAHALQPPLEDEVLAPGRLAVDTRRLRHVPDRAAHRAGLGRDVVPGDGGAARVGLRQRGEDPDGGRLAGAVRAEQAEDLALGDRERIPSSARVSFPYVFSRPSTTIASIGARVPSPGPAQAGTAATSSSW